MHRTSAPDVEGLAVEAASVAISHQAYNKALEWLEEGRSIVWNQQLQLRTPIENLALADPGLAEEFSSVSHALDHASLLRAEELPFGQDDMSLEQAAQQHRRLAERWEETVSKIQNLEGFHNFLCPRTASELAKSTRLGAVVVINVDSTRCDALVLLPEHTTVSHVPLPTFSFGKAIAARAQLEGSLRSQGVVNRGITTVRSRSGDTFEMILSMLWKDVAKPVVDFLGYSDVPPNSNLPHITWCTTGPLSFLPLHAAGEYNDPCSILHNLVVSSYIPTLSALLVPTRAPSLFSGVLGVSQTFTPGLPALPGTATELDRVQKCVTNLPFTRLDGQEATRHAVLASMGEHSWVHFACHASQDTKDPTKSAFHLSDGALDLAEITRSPLRNAQFAFLSACQTATGDEALSNESIHLAAGMIMTGYQSVVATMWSIQDKDAPLVAEKVYAYMLKGGVPDAQKAANALHEAVGYLRAEVGDKAFARWVPYIHIGR
ncbi:hypothetical protein FRC12_006378 [Ceratobasidium sp. 428]|nr:hypothetical protein FRC12_006378 [Ceratobasidium sp. 428]